MRMRYLNGYISSGATAHLSNIRSQFSFRTARLQQLRSVTISKCPTYVVQEDLEHLLFLCKGYTSESSFMLNELRKPKLNRLNIRDLRSQFTDVKNSIRLGN